MSFHPSNMINYVDVTPLLTAACSTFPGSPEHTDLEFENGEYVNIGHFVRHLVHCRAEGIVADFPCVFRVVEWVLSEGDAEARRLINDGFLDDLFNPDLYTGCQLSPVDFLPWLGRRAQRHRRVRALRWE